MDGAQGPEGSSGGSSSRTSAEPRGPIEDPRADPDPDADPEPGGDLLISMVGDVVVFSAPTPALPCELSESERSVAALVIEGRSNAEIARVRRTSTKTVANQLYAVYRKLGVETREQLVAALVEGPAAGSVDPGADES